MEQKKQQFPGLCITDDPGQAKKLLDLPVDDVKVARQAMGEVRLLSYNYQELPPSAATAVVGYSLRHCCSRGEMNPHDVGRVR